jgi:hypothetical protein
LRQTRSRDFIPPSSTTNNEVAELQGILLSAGFFRAYGSLQTKWGMFYVILLDCVRLVGDKAADYLPLRRNV